MINNGRRRGKEVNMTVGDSNDALVCFVENAVKDHIMDYSASFHATYCKEELERFKLRSGKASEISSGRSLKWQSSSIAPKTWWFREAEESFLYNVRDDKETAENGIVILKMVPETPLQFVVAERLSRTFRAKSTGIRLRILEEEWRGKDTSLAHLKDTKSHHVIRRRDITFVDSIYGARPATNSSILMKPIQKSQAVLVYIPKNLAKKDSIVVEHGLSSKITQSPGGSLNMIEGSKNSGSFEDNGRSDEEYSKHGASSKEGGIETP
ncbi:hypothetical protein Tco_0494792 [Tanacetum coccineum]